VGERQGGDAHQHRAEHVVSRSQQHAAEQQAEEEQGAPDAIAG
jgi:hypothetical protein